jgi:hypothetical protein
VNARAARPTAALVFVGSLVLAGASTLVVNALNYDAWGWLLWGRELIGRLPFSTGGYPSWKPFTALVAFALAPLGAAAPFAWLTIARLGALLAVALAFCLGRRIGGLWAGLLAAAALLVMPDWLMQTALGGSEPLLTALLLAAAERHTSGRDGQGFALMAAAAALRPESWVLFAASGIVTAHRRPGLRPAVVFGWVAVAALWFGGDYLGSGDPLHGGHLARWSREARLGRRADDPAALAVLARLGWAVPLVAVAGLPVALTEAWRRRDPLPLCLAVGGLVWFAEVAVLATLGYAGLTRFLFPAAAALSIVGSAGVVGLVAGSRSLAPVTRVVLLAALIGLAVPSGVRLADLHGEATAIEERVDLEQAVGRLFGPGATADLPGARGLSAEGVELTSIAWHAEVLPRRLHRWHFPGLRVALHDKRWRPFWRAAKRHRRGFATRTVARVGPVYLISAVRR